MQNKSTRSRDHMAVYQKHKSSIIQCGCIISATQDAGRVKSEKNEKESVILNVLKLNY